MSKFQIGLIIVLAVVLLFVAIFFWGSIASALSILCLILIPGTIAYKMIWIERENLVLDDMDPMNIVYKRHLDVAENDDK